MVNDDSIEDRRDIENEASAERGLRLRSEMGLLTPSDLAGMIGVGVRQLQTWRSDSVGPDYVKLGKRVFYRRDDVTAWVEANITVTRNREV